MLSKKARTRLLALLMAVMLSVVMLAACEDNSEDNSEKITLSFAIKNETEYEIQEITFVTGNETGRGNPFIFKKIVGPENPGDMPLDIVPLAPGEERVFTFSSISRGTVNKSWSVDASSSEVELVSSDNKPLGLNENINGFVVFYSEETEFVFAPYYQ